MEEEDTNRCMDDKETKSSDELTPVPTEITTELMEPPKEAVSLEGTDDSLEPLDEATEVPDEESKLSEPIAEASEGAKDFIPLDVSDNLNLPEKKTPKFLKAKSKIAKKSVAVNGATKARGPLKKLNNKKKVLQGNKQGGGNDQGVKKQILSLENQSDASKTNEVVMGTSCLTQEKAEKGETGGTGKENQDGIVVKEEPAQKKNGTETNQQKRKRGKKRPRKMENKEEDDEAANQSPIQKKKANLLDQNQKDKEKEKEADKKSPFQKKKGNLPDPKLKKKELVMDQNVKNIKKKEKGEEANKKFPILKKKTDCDGMIFMCNGKTKPDCFRYRVMGVSITKKDVVTSIKRGMKLFLYDFDLKLLYGIYRATAAGGVKLEPKAFNGAFPAQVRFEVHKDCLPLPESVFKTAIKENYNSAKKFSTELTSAQVKKLMRLFRPAEIHSSVISRPTVVEPPPNRDRTRKSDKKPLPVAVKKGEYSTIREKKPKDSLRNGDSRNPRPRERDHGYSHREARGEPNPQNHMYISEKDYRTWGLRGGERRNPSPPPRRPDLHPGVFRRDYQIDLPLPSREPLYQNEREYHDAALRREVLRVPVPVPAPHSALAFDPYEKDLYYSRYYRGGLALESYNPLLHRREEVLPESSYPVERRESYFLEADRRRDSYLPEADRRRESYLPETNRGRESDQLDRLYSRYAPDAQPSSHRTYTAARHEDPYVPTTSRYGDSASYLYR